MACKRHFDIATPAAVAPSKSSSKATTLHRISISSTCDEFTKSNFRSSMVAFVRAYAISPSNMYADLTESYLILLMQREREMSKLHDGCLFAAFARRSFGDGLRMCAKLPATLAATTSESKMHSEYFNDSSISADRSCSAFSKFAAHGSVVQSFKRKTHWIIHMWDIWMAMMLLFNCLPFSHPECEKNHEKTKSSMFTWMRE